MSLMSRQQAFWVLGLLVLLIGITSSPKFVYVGDPTAVRAATYSLIEHGRLDVSPEIAQAAGQPGQYFVKNPRNGRYYTKYGILNSLGYVPVMLVHSWLYGPGQAFEDSPELTRLLNIQNVLLSLVLASLLWQLAWCYTQRISVAVAWVLGTLYATFGWNYLRAQTSELLQWLLAVALFWAFVKWWRAPDSRAWLWISHGLFAALVLTKPVYVLLAIVLVGMAFCRRKQFSGAPMRYWLAVLGPLALVAGMLLWLNYYKFGCAWSSGYTQWTRERAFFSGNLFDGLWGFLFSIDKSIFIYSPYLVVGLAAIPRFWREHRGEAWAAFGGLALLMLFNSITINWGGHWSYGPRYLLACLTPATIPAILALDWLVDNWSSYLAKSAAVATLVVMLFSGWLQMQTNSLEFFTYYRVEALLQAVQAKQALQQFHRLPFGMVNYQLSNFQRRDELPGFMVVAGRELDTRTASRLAQAVQAQVKKNYYWVSD